MNYQYLKFEKLESIQILTISNPESLNALNSTLLSELDCAIDEIAHDKFCKALIITGEGRAFVAGADIAEMKDMNSNEAKNFALLGSKVFRKIENLNKPVIAALNGFTLGGGCELALACDIRIASTKMKIGQPETGLGITPGFSGTQRLPRIVGEGRAKELIYTAKAIDANEAYRIGLVNKLYEPEELMNGAIAMAKLIIKNSPSAVQLSKEAINKGMQTDIDSAISIENNLFALCFSTEDQKEGMSAFIEKREAEWK